MSLLTHGNVEDGGWFSPDAVSCRQDPPLRQDDGAASKDVIFGEHSLDGESAGHISVSVTRVTHLDGNPFLTGIIEFLPKISFPSNIFQAF